MPGEQRHRALPVRDWSPLSVQGIVGAEVNMGQASPDLHIGGDVLTIGVVGAIAAISLWSRRGSRGEDADPTAMARSNLLSARQSADAALSQVNRGQGIPSWAADRITRADQHLDDVAGYLRGRSAS
jgi:hypothetical protein